jgi:predicted phage terminase large subunit-like protein
MNKEICLSQQLNYVISGIIRVSFKSFLIKVFQTINPSNSFKDNWHLDLIIKYLESVEEEKIRRLLVNVPPRSLKSTIISVAWPAWLLGQDPTKRIIAASYSQTLSQKHSKECRLIMNSRWYKEMFPETKILRGSDDKSKFITTQNGFRFATSVNGTLTGEGADILIVDDPHTPLQAASDVRRTHAIVWFDQTFVTRLNDKKKGAIVIVMQRLHKDDLSGHLLQKKTWKHLKIPAISPAKTMYRIEDFKYVRDKGELLHSSREGSEEIDNSKLELGSYGFNAQYQQEPIAIDSNIIKLTWIKRYDAADRSFDSIYQSWDCASKAGVSNDYSVCTTWGVKENILYLMDLYRAQIDYVDLRKKVIELSECYKPSALLIEDKSSGQSLLQDLARNTCLPIIAVNPVKDKITRLITVSPIFESGRISFPVNKLWLSDLESELINFPQSDHDDQVDSITQFLGWITNRTDYKNKITAF